MNDVQNIILDKIKQLDNKVDKIAEQNERIARLEESKEDYEKRIHSIEKKMNFLWETIIGAVILGVLALLF